MSLDYYGVRHRVYYDKKICTRILCWLFKYNDTYNTNVNTYFSKKGKNVLSFNLISSFTRSHTRRTNTAR